MLPAVVWPGRDCVEMTASQKKHELLERVDRLLEIAAKSPPKGPIFVCPWLSIIDLPKYLEHARLQLQDLANDKPPIGYPVTNAVWEDFFNTFEKVEAALTNGGVDSTAD